MPNGMQIAVAGVLAQQARFDAVANDMANINTPGYRRTRVAFQEIVTPNAGDGSGGGVRAIMSGRSSAQGTLQPSDNPVSVALQGPGYIPVKLADGGIGLSRAGDLRMDGERRLVLPSGEPLEPPITVPAPAAITDVLIDPDGSVRALGKPIGKITVVEVPAPGGLLPSESGVLAVSQASGAAVPVGTKTSVVQGNLEMAGFTLADAMVSMIEAQRAFELATKAVRMQDQLKQIENEIRR
ncbi:MAG: flagellar hook basal-body protein [Actinobacteria bacterium]|nr:flagellar hook basal-body protein [Actinomycetota bacterium]